jgi:phage tail-like protein
MSTRSVSYGSYNYLVQVTGAGSPESLLGGFSDVVLPRSGAADNVAGDASGNVTKIGGLHKVGDVTLKRGVVDAPGLSDWLNSARTVGVSPRRDVTIILQNEAGNLVQGYKLQNARPIKYTGPALSGKGTDIAIEELVLSPEGIEIIPSHKK